MCLSQYRNWISNFICRDLFVFFDLRLEVVLRFCVDIVDNHCLNFSSQF